MPYSMSKEHDGLTADGAAELNAEIESEAKAAEAIQTLANALKDALNPAGGWTEEERHLLNEADEAAAALGLTYRRTEQRAKVTTELATAVNAMSGKDDKDRAAKMRALRKALRDAAPAIILDADAMKDEHPPETILWGTEPDSGLNAFKRKGGFKTRRAVLAAGEIAILSGQGGVGKSTLTLNIAASMEDSKARCGLQARAVEGRRGVMLISYEDSAARIGRRLKDGGFDNSNLHMLNKPLPLWKAGADAMRGESEPTAYWDKVFDAARDLRPALIVIDPASAALADVDTSQTGPVRQFLNALTDEAETLNAGILIVAHSTKAERERRGKPPGPGAIAGSAAWYDAIRGALYLDYEYEDGSGEALETERRMTCIKASYGQPYWEVALQVDQDTGALSEAEGDSENRHWTAADAEANDGFTT